MVSLNPATLELLGKYLNAQQVSGVQGTLNGIQGVARNNFGAPVGNAGHYGFGATIPGLGQEEPIGGVPNDVQKALGINFNKGTQFDQLDPATKQYISNAVAANKNVTQHSPSVLNRVLDVISRPEYALAAAAKKPIADIIKSVATKGITGVPGGIEQQFKDISGLAGPALQGIEGKDKASYSDDISQAYKSVGVKEGLPEKVFGVAADVIDDPTNFVGGGVTKVGKIGEILKTGEDVTKFANKADVAAKTAGYGIGDVNKFKKTLLDPTNLDLSQEAKAAKLRSVLNETVEPAAKAVGNNVLNAGKPVIADAVKSRLASAGIKPYGLNPEEQTAFIAEKHPFGFDGTPGKLVAHIKANNTQYLKAFKKGVLQSPELKKFTEEAAKASEAARTEGADVAQRALNPLARKQIVLKVGGKKLVGLTPGAKTFERAAPIAGAYDRVATRLANENGLAQRAITGFHNTFAASKLFPDLDKIRARYNSGHPVVQVNAQALADREAYGTLSKAEREASLQAVRDGAESASPEGGKDVISGAPVGNVSDYFKTRVRAVQDAIAKHPIIGRNEFLNKLPNDFPKSGSTYGKLADSNPTDPDWLLNAIKSNTDGVFTKTAKYKDPVQVLHTLTSAYARADAHASMLNEIASRFGIRSTDNGYKSAIKAGYRVPKYETGVDQVRGIKYLKDPDTAFDPEIAKQVENLHKMHMTGSGSASKFWQNYDKAQRAFKTSVTKYTPGFHSRNLQTEQLINFLHGVYDNPFKGNQALYRALKVMKIHGHAAVDGLTDLSSDLTKREAYRFNRIKQSLGSGASDSALAKALAAAPEQTGKSVIFRAHGNNVTADMIHSAYNEYGIRSGFMSAEFNKGLSRDKSLLMRGAHKANSVASAVGEAVETAPRMQHFIYDLEKRLKAGPAKGDFAKIFEKASEESAAVVRKTHFDYTDLTPTERNVFKRFIPFYTFTRKAIPSFISLMAKHPGRVLALPRAEAGLSEGLGYNRDQSNDEFPTGDFVVPDWLRDDHAVPLYGSHGTTKYLDASADPVTGLGNLVPHPSDPSSYTNALRMVTPALTVPFQIAMKKNLDGASISSTKQFLESQNPLLNNINKVGAGEQPGDASGSGSPINNAALLQFLLGLGIHDNTIKGQQATARQEEIAAQNKAKGR